MADNKTIHFIPPLPPKREKRVGIYCRVSTNSAEQLKSLAAQVSALTRLTAANPKWLLVDVYIDIASSKTGSSRKEFTRMLQDCKSRDIEIILTKSISRFGRDPFGGFSVAFFNFKRCLNRLIVLIYTLIQIRI